MDSDLKFVIPTVVSFFAALFSILTYKRNRRLENENYLFKTKIDTYSKILGELNELINRLEDYILDFKDYLKNPKKWDIEDLDKLADGADAVVFEFDKTIVVSSLIIPEKVLEKLENLSIELFDTRVPYAESHSQEEMITELDKFMTKLVDEANIISDSMRADLNIDELNTFLYRRTKR